MSVLTYNDVELPYVRTKGIDYELVMDESGIDPLWTKISVHVESLLNRSVIGMHPALWVSLNAPSLNTPRKPLKFEVNSETLLESSEGQDVHNGPIPKGLKIQEIVSDESMLVSYAVETYQHLCEGGGRNASIISHRWRETITYDERAFATWTRQGKVVFKGGIVPDNYRKEFYPDIQRGCKRVKAEFTIAEDGQSYGYTIVDQEKYLLPPQGAFKASGEYIESAANLAERIGECRVRLEGSKTSSKPALIALAVTICLDKLKPAGRIIYPMAAAIKEDLYDNVVECSVKARWGAANQDVVQGLALAGLALGRPPKYSGPTTTANDAGAFGTAGIQILSAQIQDWCSTQMVDASLAQGNPSQPAQARGTGATITVGPTPDTGGGGFSGTEATPPYTEYTVRKSYVDDRNIVQMAIAGDTNNESAIVQLAAPTKRLIVSWQIERIGSQPDVPATEPTNANAVLTHVNWEPLETVLMPDGESFRYAIAGSCTYVFKNSDQVTISAALPPWIKGGGAGVVTYKVTGKQGVIGKEA